MKKKNQGYLKEEQQGKSRKNIKILNLKRVLGEFEQPLNVNSCCSTPPTSTTRPHYGSGFFHHRSAPDPITDCKALSIDDFTPSAVGVGCRFPT
jgi:hypothetical protein